MCEIRRVIPCDALMMGLVERSPAEAGEYPVYSPGEVVTTVVLHCQPDVEKVEEDFTERVAAHHHGAPHGQHLLRDELHDAGVHSYECKSVCVHVVRLVEDLVEPGVSEEQKGCGFKQNYTTALLNSLSNLNLCLVLISFSLFFLFQGLISISF